MKRDCVLCGRVISSQRLEVLPETRRCIECARKEGSDLKAREVTIGLDMDTFKDLLRSARS